MSFNFLLCPCCKLRICSFEGFYKNYSGTRYLIINCQCTKEPINISLTNYLSRVRIKVCPKHRETINILCLKCNTWMCRLCFQFHNEKDKKSKTNLFTQIQNCSDHYFPKIFYDPKAQKYSCLECPKDKASIDLEKGYAEIIDQMKDLSSRGLPKIEKKKNNLIDIINETILLLNKAKKEILRQFDEFSKKEILNFQLTEIIYKNVIQSSTSYLNYEVYRTVKNLHKNIAEYIGERENYLDVFTQKMLKTNKNISDIFSSSLFVCTIPYPCFTKERGKRPKSILYYKPNYGLIKFKRNFLFQKVEKFYTQKSNNFGEVIELKDTRIAFCGSDMMLRLTEKGGCLPVTILADSYCVIKTVTQLNDERIVFGNNSGDISFLKKGSSKYFVEKKIKPHLTAVNQITQIDEELIASCSDDCTVKLINTLSFNIMQNYISNLVNSINSFVNIERESCLICNIGEKKLRVISYSKKKWAETLVYSSFIQQVKLVKDSVIGISFTTCSIELFDYSLNKKIGLIKSCFQINSFVYCPFSNWFFSITNDNRVNAYEFKINDRKFSYQLMKVAHVDIIGLSDIMVTKRGEIFVTGYTDVYKLS